jgi:ABC-type amino acid transport substrate-binding protein
LQTKRADFIISGISDRGSRRETADFIDYLATGPQFFVLTENAAKSPVDLCGKKVGRRAAPAFPVEIEKWSKQNCEANGKPAVQYVRAKTVSMSATSSSRAASTPRCRAVKHCPTRKSRRREVPHCG